MVWAEHGDHLFGFSATEAEASRLWEHTGSGVYRKFASYGLRDSGKLISLLVPLSPQQENGDNDVTRLTGLFYEGSR